jgi:hypothetical protein
MGQQRSAMIVTAYKLEISSEQVNMAGGPVDTPEAGR